MKYLLLAPALMLSLSALGAVKIQSELYIPGKAPSVVRDLIQTGSVEIDHVTSEGFELYGPKGLAQYLDDHNIPYIDRSSQTAHYRARTPGAPRVRCPRG